MQRIKYKKVKGNQYVTKDYYESESGNVIGFLDLDAKTFKIINIITNEVVSTGSGVSSHKLKINIKKALATLGVDVGRKEKRADRKNKAGQSVAVSSTGNSEGLSDRSSERS